MLKSKFLSLDPILYLTTYDYLPNNDHNLIKARISAHQNSSPTSMLTAIDQITKGATAIMYQVVDPSSRRELFTA